MSKIKGCTLAASIIGVSVSTVVLLYLIIPFIDVLSFFFTDIESTLMFISSYGGLIIAIAANICAIHLGTRDDNTFMWRRWIIITNIVVNIAVPGILIYFAFWIGLVSFSIFAYLSCSLVIAAVLYLIDLCLVSKRAKKDWEKQKNKEGKSDTVPVMPVNKKVEKKIVEINQKKRNGEISTREYNRLKKKYIKEILQ